MSNSNIKYHPLLGRVKLKVTVGRYVICCPVQFNNQPIGEPVRVRQSELQENKISLRKVRV